MCIRDRYYTHLKLVKHFEVLIESFRKKATEFAHVIKMGRTQLEDAVPMTLGQTFNGFASILRHEVKNLDFAAQDFLTVNMGATAIGTGITAEPEYAEKCIAALRKITGLDIKLADEMCIRDRSSPPAACIQEAAEITAAIINMTSIGGAVGCKPKPNVSIANPTPPITPSPIPPRRAPIIMAVRTNANCNIIGCCFKFETKISDFSLCIFFFLY